MGVGFRSLTQHINLVGFFRVVRDIRVQFSEAGIFGKEDKRGDAQVEKKGRYICD